MACLAIKLCKSKVKSYELMHTYLQHASHYSVLHDAYGISKSSCKSIHGSDVSDKQVLEVRGLSAYLCIKVQTSWLQATLFNYSLWQIEDPLLLFSSAETKINQSIY